MKKLVLLIILSFITLSTFSQVSVRPGVKLGTNISTITNADLNYKTGLQVGAFALVKFGNLYAIQPEILYSRQGGKSRNDELNDIKINYLSIPITNKFYIIPENGFHLLIGPSLDLSVGDSINDLNESPEYNILDIAFFVGTGYEFDFGLTLETRYKHGIINVDLFGDTDDQRFDVREYVLNSVFQIAAAYKFDF